MCIDAIGKISSRRSESFEEVVRRQKEKGQRGSLQKQCAKDPWISQGMRVLDESRITATPLKM
jgi:hypothetical protein